VLAGALHDIPLYGTMAHSFVQTHDDEAAAFERFARSHPTNATILIDTYDVEAAAVEVASLHRRLASEGNPIRAVRIDSGDLAAHASRVRQILDREGASDVQIFASGDLDEKRVAQLLARGAPIDGFGIGTRLATSADAPSLDIVYKLQEYAGQARRKRSEGKATWPGRKQVRRRFTEAGLLCEDRLTLMDEEVAGEPLLRPFMRNGRRVAAAVPLAEIRSHARAELGRLPQTLRVLRPVEGYSVAISSGIRELAERLDRGVNRPRRTEARPSRRSSPSSR
jgi:nicotinate phosphoribosyltransferase